MPGPSTKQSKCWITKPQDENIAIFIDVLNVIVQNDCGRHQLRLINWTSLLECIANGRKLEMTRAYLVPPIEIKSRDVSSWPLAIAMKEAGIDLRLKLGTEKRSRKVDIDPIMAFDLGVLAATPTHCVGSEIVDTVAIVTGDNDFLYAVKEMSEAGFGMEIYSWKEKLAEGSGLWNHAEIYWLDDFERKILSV